MDEGINMVGKWMLEWMRKDEGIHIDWINGWVDRWEMGDCKNSLSIWKIIRYRKGIANVFTKFQPVLMIQLGYIRNITWH